MSYALPKTLIGASRILWCAVLATTVWLSFDVPVSARAQKLSPDGVNRAQYPAPIASRRENAVLLKAQVLLDRLSFSPGLIDAKPGDNLAKAIAAFQRSAGIAPTGRLDRDTWQKLSNGASAPVLVEYRISQDDVRGPFERRIPRDLKQMAKLTRLGYASSTELLAEKFHIDERLLKELNPGKPLDRADTAIVVPNVLDARPDGAVATIEIDKAQRAIRALNENGGLVAFYPASIGSTEKPAPSGTFRVRKIVENPTYHYDPRFKFKGVNTRRKLTIAPGPNNPVGVVWIDLTKPSYGIHGTPDPGKIGKTYSHGCIRLTNWDALDLARRVRKGIDVAFLD